MQCASRNRRGGDREKTLGEAKKTFICWRKRFIIIPGMSLSPLPHHRFVYDFTSYIIYVLHLNKVCSHNSLFSRQGLTTRNQVLDNTYIWLQYGFFGCSWNQLHLSLVVDRWLQLEWCNSLRQPHLCGVAKDFAIAMNKKA